MKRTAGDLILAASRIRAEAEAAGGGLGPIGPDLARADKLEDRPRQPLPERLNEKGAGRELVPNGHDGREAAEFRSTLRNPDYVAADASRDRLELLHQAGSLEAGLDVADTVGAQNSIELMVAHQIAAAHRSSLLLSAQLNRQIDRMGVIADGPRQAANVEATRIAGAVARLMLVVQGGALTLQKLRTGGTQTVTVQHVTVGAGGQAVVTGQVATGGRGGEPTGGAGENEQ